MPKRKFSKLKNSLKYYYQIALINFFFAIELVIPEELTPLAAEGIFINSLIFHIWF